VDSTSAPIAGLAIISTWIGYEVGLFGQVADSLHLQADGYSLFFDALPFRFYCIMMIIFTFCNIFSGIDYGSMASAQQRCSDEDNQSQDDDLRLPSRKSFQAENQVEPHIKIRARTAIIPIGSLFFLLLSGLWIDGGGIARLSSNYFSFLSLSTWRLVMSAGENNILILAIAAGCALLIAILCARFNSCSNTYSIQT